MELRPGYKKTVVGTIPEDWDVMPLGAIGDSLIGLTYRPEDVRDYGTLVLRASNIQNNSLRFDNNVFVDKQIPERIMVRPNDVLICVRNGSRELIGKSVLLDERTDGMTFGAFMAVFRSNSGEFISHLFQSDILRRQIVQHLGATINQITNKSLNSFVVPYPKTIEEQDRIAAVLDDVHALLDGLERLIAKKRDLKQAAMQQLLTGQTRLPGFTGEWIMRRLGDVAPLQRGFDLPNPLLKPGPYPVVYSNGVLYYHKTFRVTGPGVVTGRSGTIGKVTFVEEDYWPHNTTLWVTSFGDNSPKFVFYIYTRLSFERFASGSGVPTLNRNDVHDFEVLMPPTTFEQNAIAAVLTDIDAEIETLEQRITKTRDLKQAMMQELLTGKTRLVTLEAIHA